MRAVGLVRELLGSRQPLENLSYFVESYKCLIVRPLEFY